MEKPARRSEATAASLAWVYFAAVMCSYALITLHAAHPPAFVDYPDWVYQGVLFQHVLAGHPIHGYALKSYPVPNSATTIGIGLLCSIFSWQKAGEVWICVYLALAGAASYAMARTTGRNDWQLVISLPTILFLNLDFWYGHISVEIGLCLLMLLVCLLFQECGPLAVSAMLTCIFFVHMEACAAACLLTMVWYGSRRQWPRLLSLAPAIALTLWYGIARFRRGNADAGELTHADYRYGSPAFLIYKANTYLKTFGYVNARTMALQSQSERIFGRGLFLVLLAAAVCLSALILYKLLRLVGAEGNNLRFFVLILLIVSLLLPQVTLAVADPGSRLLLMAAAVGVFFVPWKGRGATCIAALSVMLCVANLWQFARIEANPRLPGEAKNLPATVLTFGHVEPEMRLGYYDSLQRGAFDQSIFPTGLFLRQR
jgi:hypothetical protein